MDILRILRLIRAHWVLSLIGLLLGCFAAFAVSYQPVRVAGGIALAPRSRTVYETQVQLLIAGPKFDLGSALVLPDSRDALTRALDVAPTYAQLVLSDVVLESAVASVGGFASVDCKVLEKSPILKVTVSDYNADHAVAAASAVSSAFIGYLKQQQDENGVPANDRLQVTVMGRPSPARPVQSRALEVALLAFLTPVLIVVGVESVIDRQRLSRLSSTERKTA